MPQKDAKKRDCDRLETLEGGVDDDDDVADDLAEPEVNEPLRMQHRKFAHGEEELTRTIKSRFEFSFFILIKKTKMNPFFNSCGGMPGVRE